MTFILAAVVLSLAALSANAQSYTNNNVVTLPMYVDWNALSPGTTDVRYATNRAENVHSNVTYPTPVNCYTVEVVGVASASTITNWAKAGVLCAALGHVWQEKPVLVGFQFVQIRRCYICEKAETLVRTTKEEWK